ALQPRGAQLRSHSQSSVARLRDVLGGLSGPLRPAHRRKRLVPLAEEVLAARKKGAETRKARCSQSRCRCFPSRLWRVLGKQRILRKEEAGASQCPPNPCRTQRGQSNCERLLLERRGSLSVPELLCSWWRGALRPG